MSKSALPKRASASANMAVSPPIPILKCCGMSKNLPGTIEVSYFSKRSARKASTLPFFKRGNATVPNSSGIQSRSSRALKKALSSRLFVSSKRQACAAISSRCSSAMQLKRSAA